MKPASSAAIRFFKEMLTGTRTLTGFLPEGMPRYWQMFFVVLGTALAFLGLLSLFNSIIFLREHGTMPILSVIYIILNLSLAYGFITGKKWLVPILGLNWLGNFFISSVYIHLSQTDPSISLERNILVITITGIFFFSAFLIRKKLQGKYFRWLVSIPLLLIWLLAFLFNFLILLTNIPALKGVIY